MRRLSLRARLALLVLVGVVPFLGFNLGSSYLTYRHARIEANGRMLDIARGMALAVEGELRSRVAILEVLALSDALARNDMTAFRAEADAARALQEPGTHILLMRGDGQQLLNTALPPGTPLPTRPGLDNLQRVLASNRPSASDVYLGQVFHRPIVAIEVPVPNPVGGVRVGLSLTPTLGAFDGIIRRQVADQNLRVVIIDRLGQRIARFPAVESLSGPMQPPDFMRVWRPGLEGTTQIVLPGGEHRILGFSPVPQFGWTIVVGISAEQVTAPAWHAATMTLAVGLGLLLVGGALAHLISHSVIGPISKLSHLASAAESGDVLNPVGTGLRETDEVAAILLADARERDASMAAQARDAEALKRSNKALTDEVAMRQGAETALRHAKRVADEASQAKSRFLTGITHELRTPLHGILGYAELLGLEGGLNPAQSGRVSAMIAAGEHLLGMINAVLDVSQIEAGRLELNPVEIELADLAAACLDVVRPKAEAKGLALALTVTSPGRVSADVTRLRQVLINLLGNAIKFTSAGKVDLRLTRTSAGDGVRLEVVDTGPGIWARHREKLFRAFERLNAHAVEGVEGTGLGLALTAQLVRAMDGRIGYRDNPGGGSIFWVELPAILESPTTPNVAVAWGRDTTPGVRLLVVDDDALNREIASRFLTLGGHEVVCLDNGAAAVEAAKTEDFDAILMDVRMPGMNGLEATSLIRRLPGPRGAVPVLALTAQAFAEQIEICRQAGMIGHVSKPFSQETLLAAVAKIVPARLAAESAATDIVDPDRPVFEDATFEEAIGFLAPAEAAEYLRTLIARGEALARDLDAGELRPRTDALADAAHKVAGSAAMLGFLSLADIGRRFEFAAQSDAPELEALAGPLATAVATALTILQQKLSDMVVPALD